MEEASTAEDCVNLLRRLEEVLRTEGGQDWLPGIETVRKAGESGLGEGDEAGAIAEMSRIYRGMHAGPVASMTSSSGATAMQNVPRRTRS